MDKKSVAKNYRFLAILLSCMVAGALLGWFRPKWGHSIAFLGTVFINMMFCVVVPLVFASIAGSVANMESRQRAGKIMGVTVGTFVITTGATGQGEMAGILVVLAAVVTWSVASVFMRQLTAKYPPILVTAYGMVISLIFHIPTGVAAAVQAGGTGLSSANILVVLYLGLVGSGLAQYTWTASLAELPASTCSLFYPLQPMFSALLGMLLLNETFTPSFLVGLVLISADVILSTLETRKLAKQAQAGSDR